MILRLIYSLRELGVPVGTHEAVTLAHALRHNMHECSLDRFYEVARCLLVHSEAHLDDFDLAFSHVFRGVALESKKLTDDLLSWLSDPITARSLSAEERQAIEALDPEELLRRFEERLREQKERHDGGSHWIGTGGTSPFGHSGFHPSGISVGSTARGRGSAVMSADARQYRGYRTDLVLDVRQTEIALRRLRSFNREGVRNELDVDRTIAKTAANAGDLEIVLRPQRRPNTRVLLIMDVGGSMDPYAYTMSQLFSAAKRATHWKELKTYYFHNAIYGQVYRTEGFEEPLRIDDLMHNHGAHYKVFFVGDAAMAPYELLAEPSWSQGRGGKSSGVAAITHFARLREHFPRSVWVNPERFGHYAHPTIDAIRSIFPMYSLTVEGLTEAIRSLTQGAPRRQ